MPAETFMNCATRTPSHHHVARPRNSLAGAAKQYRGEFRLPDGARNFGLAAARKSPMRRFTTTGEQVRRFAPRGK